MTHYKPVKKLVALFVFMAFACFGKATPDSVQIDLSMVNYSSDFEKSRFQALDKEAVFDSLGFLLCLDSAASPTKAAGLRLKLNNFYDEKLIPLQKGKTGDKLIKAVFKEIHDNLLSKYVLDAHFENILDKGEYNCVTASALYALSFQKLGIAYQLRSTTDHVYVIANPGPNQLVIETTDPTGGAYSYNEQFKKAYIEMLLNQKLISKQEYSSSTIEALFQKHYYTADTINFRQLIGYHYYNSGVELMNAENYERSCSQLLKSYYLNNKKQVAHMLSLALAVQLNKAFDVTDSAQVNLYFLFSRLYGETDYATLYDRYVRSSDELIVRQDDLEKFQSISAYIFGFLSDTVELQKFQEHYYYACAYGAYQKKDFINSYFYIANAYCLNSKHIRIKAMYEELQKNIFFLMYNNYEYGKKFDSVLLKLDNSSGICGKNNSDEQKFQLMMMRVKLHFTMDKVEEGTALLSEAEKFAAESKLTDFEDSYIDMGYSTASTHYYTRYEISKAKEFIQRGLKLDPGNEELKSELDRLNKMGNVVKPSGAYNLKPPPPPPPVKNQPSSPRTVIVKTPN